MAATRTAGILFLLACSIGAGAAPSLNAQSLGKDVNDAIKKGVAVLKAKQQEDGTFESEHREGYPDGVAALGLLALIKSRVPQSDVAVQRSLTFLRYRPTVRTYSTAVRILALEALGDAKYDQAIQSAAQWLVDTFRTDVKEWAYPEYACDLSNTQYAVLGLWAAERHGFKTPRDLWPNLAKAVMKHQNADGGFGYRAGDVSTGSMTTAGVAVLTICGERMPRGQTKRLELDDSVERGWAYLERRFHPEGNPVGEHAYHAANYYYFLYGLERACAIGDRRKLGEHDWYKECATHLVKTQAPEGNWGSTTDTCFALLFLRLSTFTAMGKEAPAGMDEGAAAERPAAKPAGNAPFVRRWLLLGPFEDKDESGLAADLIGEPDVDPQKGRSAKGRKWSEHASRSPRIALDDVFPGTAHAVAYAFCCLQVNAATEALLWFGADDGARVWLDSELVHDHPFRGSEGPDAHSVPVQLDPGLHRLLVKVANFDGQWHFYLRFTGKDGRPVEGIVPFCGDAGPVAADILDFQAQFLDESEIFGLLAADRKGKLTFDSEADLERVLVVQQFADVPFMWMDGKTMLHNRLPQPGAEGVLFVHPLATDKPVRVFRKVRVTGQHARIKARVAAGSPEIAGNVDFIARLGFLAVSMEWSSPTVIKAGTKEKPAGWYELSMDLGDVEGQDVLVVLECAAGGPSGDWFYENGFVDEFSVER